MESIKSILEIVYYLSGPVIAYIAYLALGQIRISKEQIKEQRKSLQITSKREALKLTSDQVFIYSEKIIPLQNKLNEKISAEGVDFINKFKVEVESGSVNVIRPAGKHQFSSIKKIIPELVDVANAMESFSTYFVSGVADEKLAYLSLGSTFCNSVERIAPVIVPTSNQGKHFNAVLNLYVIWKSRLEAENLEKQKNEIETKLKGQRKVSVEVLGEHA